MLARAHTACTFGRAQLRAWADTQKHVFHRTLQQIPSIRFGSPWHAGHAADAAAGPGHAPNAGHAARHAARHAAGYAATWHAPISRDAADAAASGDEDARTGFLAILDVLS